MQNLHIAGGMHMEFHERLRYLIDCEEIKIKDLSQIVLEMLASLNAMNKRKDRLIEITADGKISDDELEDFLYIQEELERISITVETLQLWAEKMLAAGVIDEARYEAYRSRKKT